jgi:hypothetical protein
MLRRSDKSAAAVLQNSLLESVPHVSYDLLAAIIDTSVSIWNRDLGIGENWTKELVCFL